MEKKWSPKNIALLVLVVGVWVYMGLRAFNYFDGEEETIEDTAEDSGGDSNISGNSQKGNYLISTVDYRDPFFDKGRRTRRRSVTVSHQPSGSQNPPFGNPNHNPRLNGNGKDPNQSTEDTRIQWPTISYSGIITHPHTNKGVAFLIIDGKEDFQNIGESRRGVKVLSFSNDQVTVSFQGEEKTFQR